MSAQENEYTLGFQIFPSAVSKQRSVHLYVRDFKVSIIKPEAACLKKTQRNKHSS